MAARTSSRRWNPGRAGELSQGRRGRVLREVHASRRSTTTTAGRSNSKPATPSPSHQLSPASKSIGTNESASGTPTPISWRRCRFHACVAPSVDLEDAGGELGTALGERVEAGTEEDDLRDAGGELLADQILDEARSGHHRCAETTGEGRIHVGPLAPRRVGRDELQAERVFEHVRRSVDLDMERSPQRGTGHRACCRGPRGSSSDRHSAARVGVGCAEWLSVIALRAGAPSVRIGHGLNPLTMR